MTADRLSPLKHKRTWRDRDPLPGILREWYGHDFASREILGHLPQEIPVSDALSRVIGDIISPDELQLQRLREHWEKVVGKAVARVTKPCRLSRGVLFIEVRGAAMIMELNNHSRKIVLQKIHQFCGESFCHDLRFSPEG